MKNINITALKSESGIHEIITTNEESLHNDDFIFASIEAHDNRLIAISSATLKTIDKLIHSSEGLLEDIESGVRERKLASLKWTKLNKPVKRPVESFDASVATLVGIVKDINTTVTKIEKGQAKDAMGDIDKFIKEEASDKFDKLEKWTQEYLININIDSELDNIERMIVNAKSYVKTIREIRKNMSMLEKIKEIDITDTVSMLTFINTTKRVLVRCNDNYRKLLHRAISILNRMVQTNQ